MGSNCSEQRSILAPIAVLKKISVSFGLSFGFLAVQGCDLIQQLQENKKIETGQFGSIDIERNDLELSPMSVLAIKSEPSDAVYAVILENDEASLEQILGDEESSCEVKEEKLVGVMFMFAGNSIDDEGSIIEGKYNYKRPEQIQDEDYVKSTDSKPKKLAQEGRPALEDSEVEKAADLPSLSLTKSTLGFMLKTKEKKAASSSESFEYQLPDFAAVAMTEDGTFETMFGSVKVTAIDGVTYLAKFNLKGEFSGGKFVGSMQFKVLESSETDQDECEEKSDQANEEEFDESSKEVGWVDPKPPLKKKAPKFGSVELEIKGLPTESDPSVDYLRFTFEPVGEVGKRFTAETDLISVVKLPEIRAGVYKVIVEQIEESPKSVTVKSAGVELEILPDETAKAAIELIPVR